MERRWMVAGRLLEDRIRSLQDDKERGGMIAGRLKP